MTEEEARAHAEGLALSMGIIFYVVRTGDGDFLARANATRRLRARRDGATRARERSADRVSAGTVQLSQQRQIAAATIRHRQHHGRQDWLRRCERWGRGNVRTRCS